MSDYCVYHLRCIDRENPIGIDEKPYFSWKLSSDKNDVFQKNYEVLVYKDEKIIWTTGPVESENCSGISYDGNALENAQNYSWKVISTNNHGDKAESENAFFSTGKYDKSGFKARFITSGFERKPICDTEDAQAIFSGAITSNPTPENILDAPDYFRKPFELEQPIKKAILYATALGIYSLYVDGNKVSNLLAPEYTSYNSFLEYQTYDVTELLREKGHHVIGAILADGWYSGKIGLMGIGHQYGKDNALMFQLELTLEDGSRQLVVSDEDTLVSKGAYIYADLFVGEYYDFNKGFDAFSTRDFDDSSWKTATKIDLNQNNLTAQSVNPVAVVREIKPSLIVTPKEEFVLDAGENIAGYTRCTIESEGHLEVCLEHSEVLDKEGNFLQNIMGQNKNQKDRFITTPGLNNYEPQFTFHGFRYVKVTGLKEVDPADFTIVVIASPLDKTGDFSCSDERLTKLQENIFRSQQANMICIPTDCPQRERAGWTGDMEIYAPTAAFNMDIRPLMRRWLRDMRAEQLADGQIPNIIPDIPSNNLLNHSPDSHVSSAGWGDACIFVPYAIYQAYGNVEVLSENYEMMEKWTEYILKNSGDDLMHWGDKFHFGDWLIPSIVAKTHNPIMTSLCTKQEVATIYLEKALNSMSEISSILGYQEKAEYYLRLVGKVKSGFEVNYVNEDGLMRQPLQGLYVLALAEHMLNEKQEKGAIEELCRLIKEANYSLDTGFLSIPYLMEVLFEYKKSDIAYKILYNDDNPGWLYAVKNGATTVWENWAAILPDGTRTNSSYNHFAFGCIGSFLYSKIGGINFEDSGYKSIRIDPDYSCGLKNASTSFESPNGLIRVDWTREKNKIKLNVTIPPNTTGIVNLVGKQIEVGNGKFEFIIAEAPVCCF